MYVYKILRSISYILNENKKQIGIITAEIVSILDIDKSNINKPILIGDSNIKHMKNRHPKDFEDFGNKIEDIIKNPTYIGLHPRQKSIEYIKEFEINGKIVLCAVRISSKGIYFARSLYRINKDTLNNYLMSNTTKRLEK